MKTHVETIDYQLTNRKHVWNIISTEWRYIHLKTILVMIPNYIAVTFLLSLFMSFDFGSFLGVMAGTSVIVSVLNNNKQKKGIMHCKLPVSIAGIAFVRLFNTLIQALFFLLFMIVSLFIFSNTSLIKEGLFVTSVYMLGGVLWLIVDDLTKLKKHQFLKSRVILLLAMIIGAGIVIINPLNFNFDQGIIVLIVLEIILSVISIKTYKRRLSYLS